MKQRRAMLIASLWLAVLVSFTTIRSAYAQDPSFSQFYANRVYLNPAFVGLESGITVSGVARMQWINVDHGFKTYGATVETQLPFVRTGIGLHVMSDEEGIAGLKTNQAGLVFSYVIPGQNSNIHFGMEGRLVQKSIDWDKLIFSDQIDPVYGVFQGSSMVPVLDNVMYGDFDFGVMWRHESKLRMTSKSMSSIRSHFGLSFHHLPYLFSNSAKGNDSFLNRESAVAPRTTIHGGMIIPITYLNGSGLEVSLSPNFKIDNQGYKFMSFGENITVSTIGLYSLVNNFYMGFLYQNRYHAPSALHTDAVILTVGGYTNSTDRTGKQKSVFFFGFSADLNSTGVGPAAGSVFEFTFRYRFLSDLSLGGGGQNSRNSSKNRVLDCKSFF